MAKPTIAQYLRDVLLHAGPLTLDELTEQVVAQGLTKARTPAVTVGGRLRDEPDLIELPDGRFDSLGRLLVGAVQTYRVTAHAVLVGELCTDDLALLLAVPDLHWVDGSTRGRWSRHWLPIAGLSDLAAGDLIGFRVRNATMVAEPLAPATLLANSEREHIVIDELRRKASSRGDRYPLAQNSAACNPVPALISLLTRDPAFFVGPMAPMTELIDRAGLPRAPVRRYQRDLYSGYDDPWSPEPWSDGDAYPPLRVIPFERRRVPR